MTQFKFSNGQQEQSSDKQTFYKRVLPEIHTSFSSQKGKNIFIQAYHEGNMQCYFPLSEQFLTQMSPYTCGPSTLTMILNALAIDPQKKWKLIWRWWSEQNLEGITEQNLNKGMDLQEFTHLSKHNYTQIQTFYYPHTLTNPTVNKYDCQLSCPRGIKRIASFESFKSCLLASCRRNDIFMVLNLSRKVLQQTGDGHFMTIGGFNQQQNQVLCFDVARFKYPPFWCNIQLLYQSLSFLDTSTDKPRGFCLISKQNFISNFINNQNYNFDSKDYVNNEIFQNLVIHTKYSTNINDFFKTIIENFSNDLRYILVYYLFEFQNQLDIEQQKQNIGEINNHDLIQECQRLKIYQILVQINEEIKQTLAYNLINDFVDQKYCLPIFCIILQSLPKFIYYNNQQLQNELEQYITFQQKDNNKNIQFQIQLLKNIFAQSILQIV